MINNSVWCFWSFIFFSAMSQTISVINRSGGRAIFYTHQTCGACVGVCACNRTHQVEKTVNYDNFPWNFLQESDVSQKHFQLWYNLFFQLAMKRMCYCQTTLVIMRFASWAGYQNMCKCQIQLALSGNQFLQHLRRKIFYCMIWCLNRLMIGHIIT